MSTAYILILLYLAVYDLWQRRLPNAAVLLLALLGGYAAFVEKDLISSLAAGATAFVLFYITKVAYLKKRGVDGLGMGDVKLIGAIGLWVGFLGLPWVIFIGSALALIYAILIKCLGIKNIADARLPYGTFLSLSAIPIFLY